MEIFSRRSITLTGQISLAGQIDHVFELFSPLGEKLWVPGWDPRLLHPPGASWEEGLIFLTQEEGGDAVWIVAQLDREEHRVTYYRVEPDRYVAKVDVECIELTNGATEAKTAYQFVALTEKGNHKIQEMSQAAYDAKMQRWQQWINEYLRRSI